MRTVQRHRKELVGRGCNASPVCDAWTYAITCTPIGHQCVTSEACSPRNLPHVRQGSTANASRDTAIRKSETQRRMRVVVQSAAISRCSTTGKGECKSQMRSVSQNAVVRCKIFKSQSGARTEATDCLPQSLRRRERDVVRDQW